MGQPKTERKSKSMSDKKESAPNNVSRRTMLGSLASLGLSLPLLEAAARGQKRQPDGQRINLALQSMVEAAQKLLNLLGSSLQSKALFPMDSDERFNWHYIPTLVSSLPNATQMNLHKRSGVSIKEMTLEQRLAAHALLRSALSTQGYLKATAIMHLEDVLREIEITLGRNVKEATAIRDPELYFFSIFGSPSKDLAWGWRVEGHHLSLHFSLIGNSLIVPLPAFMGSNPAVVAHGTHAGSRIFTAEEHLARELLMSFDTRQSSLAVIATTAPNEIATKNNRKADLGTPKGLAVAKMTSAQRELLMKLVQEYAGNFSSALADVEMNKIRTDGIERIHFAWAGSNELGKAHYYRIHSPKLLIEYDNSQNNANHIHLVYRNLENDFGVDMLRQHYEKSAHHK
jgi:hypothetical protein